MQSDQYSMQVKIMSKTGQNKVSNRRNPVLGKLLPMSGMFLPKIIDAVFLMLFDLLASENSVGRQVLGPVIACPCYVTALATYWYHFARRLSESTIKKTVLVGFLIFVFRYRLLEDQYLFNQCSSCIKQLEKQDVAKPAKQPSVAAMTSILSGLRIGRTIDKTTNSSTIH